MEIDIDHELSRLIGFALSHGLIEREDIAWAANGLIDALGRHAFLRDDAALDDAELPHMISPEPILERILDWAVGEGLIQGTIVERDLLDTRLMGILTPRPSDVAARFRALLDVSPRAATDWAHALGVSSNYIRATRSARDVRWKTTTEHGELDITINLAKPEKDPRDIAKARSAPVGYPQCLLCRENEGFAGHVGHPARQTLRLFPLELRGERWYLQYSPYSYYDEHCIVLSERHVPMRICRATFERLIELVSIFPHYFFGSNADLPIVGGSILSHDHYQGGRYIFPMERAPIERTYAAPRVEAGRVAWPMSALRLASPDAEALIDVASRVLGAWREWDDPSVGILAESDGAPLNTITPIARRRGDVFELDLVLRNARTSEEHPLGVFHPHADVQHIKKENIGLIEVMGLAILPARLKGALDGLAEAWAKGEGDLSARPELAAHDAWYRGLRARRPDTPSEDVPTALREEVGRAFFKVLCDSGVYARDPEGLAAFDRFATAALS